MRMIDRWFPCAEVSDASYKAHGSGATEKALFTWFASRPVAQARAAALTSLLPWPETEDEQERLKEIVRQAVLGTPQALRAAVAEIARTNPERPRVVDFFSGRAIISLEAARVGAEAWGIDYSPVATLAGMLLADFPFRDWTSEPPLAFDPEHTPDPDSDALLAFKLLPPAERLVRDVTLVLAEIAERHEATMDAYYPRNLQGQRPWGYLWCQTMPCDECKHHFPLIGSTILAPADRLHGNNGQSFTIGADRATGNLEVVVREEHLDAPTLISAKGKRGKRARCPFCDHTHPLDVIKARANAGALRDLLLIVADPKPGGGYTFREPTPSERTILTVVEPALRQEPHFAADLSAVPNELIPPGNNHTVRGSLYGARTYGDLCMARQTLSFIRLCRIIAGLQTELQAMGLSDDYVRALLGYAGSVVVRKLRYSTRGATLQAESKKVHDIFKSQATLNYGFDFFETGIGKGAATWDSLTTSTIGVLKKLTQLPTAMPARIRQGSALHLPFRPKSVSAVITDPPYDSMIDYSDASDLFFVWLKRALGRVFPELFDLPGVQEKDEEIIVKDNGVRGDHRTEAFYRASLKQAFVNARTVLRDDGALTVVFGHGDPEAWYLLLSSLQDAGFVVTGSWPARTEASGGADAATIVVTLTIACRPAPPTRPDGLQAAVDLEIERAVRARIVDWERDNMALADRLMASSGPAMEVVGNYRRILRPDGSEVGMDHYLKLARRTVQEAASIKIENLPLETFDARTRYALFWAGTFGRQLQAKSEAAFQAMSSNLRLEDVRKGILEESRKGYKLSEFGEMHTAAEYHTITPDLALIDVVRAMVRAWRMEGGQGVANVMSLAERDEDDLYLWAVIGYLASVLPATDQDRKALEDITRNRRAIGSTRVNLERQREAARGPQQLALFTENPLQV